MVAPFSVALDDARAACLASIDGFLTAAASVSEHALLTPSRCHGWDRMDVVVHMVNGWLEALGGLVSPGGGPPTVDAAGYWDAFAEQHGDEDAVATLMSQRRRTAAYLRPASAMDQLRDVGASLSRGFMRLDYGHVTWQGEMFTAGDYCAIWAVENVIHHLDLGVETAPPADALGVARRTIEALAGADLPSGWSDEAAVLIGSGRVPSPAHESSTPRPLPVLG